MRDEQRGMFYGLGIQISKRGPDKPLTIIAPIDGTPAAKAGLQLGDVIAKIEGQETSGLTVQDAVRKLKGEKGTKVTITFFFSSRRRHTSWNCDWSSDVCSSDLSSTLFESISSMRRTNIFSSAGGSFAESAANLDGSSGHSLQAARLSIWKPKNSGAA